MIVQGCALAVPDIPWRLTFAFGRPGNVVFAPNLYMLSALDFKGLGILGTQLLLLEHSLDCTVFLISTNAGLKKNFT